MFSQSCNCLPNKKQSFFCNRPSQNMGLLSNLTNKSFSDSADHLSIEFEATKKRNNNDFGSRTNIMDIVYSFTETSRIKFNRRYISTFSIPTESSKLNCKEIITHCNTMTASPFVRSYLVGGFVGSKSQIGRRRKNDGGKINLWDMIRDLVDLVGNSPANFPGKQDSHSSSSVEKKCEGMQNSGVQKEVNHTNTISLIGLEERSPSLKQSYADVAKRPLRDHSCITTQAAAENQSRPIKSSANCKNIMPVIQPEPVFSNRDRITSECSADSEDSFIVFECCEDDKMDKDIDSSDDETLSCFDEVSQSDSGIVPSSNSSFCIKPSPKKVRFAEGKNLVTVHPMVTWDYAYRMARKGPWEMLARDSERFKLRIAKVEAVLKPILDPQHRSVVFRDRFDDSLR